MLRILHLEDCEEDAFFISEAILHGGVEASFTVVKSRPQFIGALEQNTFDLILADSGLPGFDAVEALTMARQKFPDLPIISVSGLVTDDRAATFLAAGAVNCFSKDHLNQLVAAVRGEQEKLRLRRLNRAKSRLVQAVQELSLTRDLAGIMAIVRHAARELTGADGATFVLREGDFCHYADEEAIAPLWKGQKFPLTACISGWAMLNRQPAVIKDIYADPRIPADAYRPTFVKSLAMVPIRTESPIGAIGNYWAAQHLPTDEEVELLQALANTTAVAMENVRVYAELEKRVQDRTAELAAANRELESFSYAVSHDLSAPLRSIRGWTEILLQQSAGRLDDTGRAQLERIRASGKQMTLLIDDLLRLAKFSKVTLKCAAADLSQMAGEILARLAGEAPGRTVSVRVADGLMANGDAGLLRAAMENLLSNAWKYTGKNPAARIEFDSRPEADGSCTYFVRDNGAGFDMQHARRLFQAFQRLHQPEEFSGTGVGLATVQRIIQRHGGRIWAEAEPGKGATFFFTLGVPATGN